MERRYLAMTSCPVGLEQRVGTDPPYLVGYAAVFYNAKDPGTEYTLWDYENDRCVERLMSTAFDRVLEQGELDVAGLFNHDANCILGRCSAGTLTVSKDARGLHYRITPPDAPIAQGVIASIRRGDIRGSSFSFQVDRDGCRYVSQGGLTVREVHDVKALYDVGPVTFPAYSSSTTGMRSTPGADEARVQFEEWKKTHTRVLAGQARARARCAELGL